MNHLLNYPYNYKIRSQILFLTIGVLILFGINMLVDFSHITSNRPQEGYRYEYAFSLLLLNFIYLWVIFNLKNSINNLYVWFSFIVFCVYTYWSQDYFHMGVDFYKGIAIERDILYSYLMPLSLEKYSILRLLIWGTALFLTFKIFEKFKIQLSISTYVFALLYLVFFSYPRASLGMAFYFYGLTYIICPSKISKFKKIIIVLICFFLSFCAHRSMLILIALTPLMYIKINKCRLILLLILIPIIIFLIQNYLIIFLLQSGSSSFSTSAQRYMEMQSDLLILSNWKFKLIESLKVVGFFIPSIYLIYLFWLKKNQNFPKEFQLLMRIILIIVVIASLFLLQVQSAGYGVYITGYRILLMAGIPLCVILSYSYQRKKISLTKLNFLILFDFLYGELYMLGKIFFSNLKE